METRSPILPAQCTYRCYAVWHAGKIRGARAVEVLQVLAREVRWHERELARRSRMNDECLGSLVAHTIALRRNVVIVV